MTAYEDTRSDAVLLAGYAAGDRAAALALTRRLTPRVLGQAMRMLGNRAEAEEVAQEAMLRLWKAAPDWQNTQAQVSSWLYRVTANLCLDRLRRSGRFAPLDAAGDPADDAPSAAAQMQDTARVLAVRQALARLPERQAKAVALRHLEGLSNPAIAEIMDTNVRTVESLVARGKRAISAALAGRKSELGYQDDG